MGNGGNNGKAPEETDTHQPIVLSQALGCLTPGVAAEGGGDAGQEGSDDNCCVKSALLVVVRPPGLHCLVLNNLHGGPFSSLGY